MTFRFGPGLLVAAAFIGPGTVTACTLAGSNFGFALAWALVFATVATIILQDMTARLGAGAQLGLGEALMQNANHPIIRWTLAGLVFSALVIGNSAYEGGNITGSVLGLEALLSGSSSKRIHLIVIVGSLACLAVSIGQYKILERILIFLVLVMSVAFILSAIVVRPDLGSVFNGFVPQIPDGGVLTAVALIGTTIVPYNLFLHSAAVRRKWSQGESVTVARTDSAISIGLGGLVSLMILATSATTLFQESLEIKNAADMAVAIEPAFGEAARYLIGIGLFAAGLTSAITAPMATAYVLIELVGIEDRRKTQLFRATAIAVVLKYAHSSFHM